MATRDVSTIRQATADKYRRVAVSPEGLFRYPTGEASALGLGYPPVLVARVPDLDRARFVGVGNPFPDASFDIALSNGVLNLIPDKPAALCEVFRVLKPGGRLQVCDMGLVGEAPPPDKAPWSD